MLPRRRFHHADSLPLHILYTERVFLYDPRGDGDGEEQPQALPVELGRLVVPEGRGERAWSRTGHAAKGQWRLPRTTGSSCAASWDQGEGEGEGEGQWSGSGFATHRRLQLRRQ